MTKYVSGAQMLDASYNVPWHAMALDIRYLNSIRNKLSINNLISILLNRGVDVNDIHLISQMSTASDGHTILRIYQENNIINIQINIFKIDVFSRLEETYNKYIYEDYSNLMATLEYGLNKLSISYVLVAEQLLRSMKTNSYSLPNNSKISCFINAIHQELAEDHPSAIVSYEKSMCRLPCKSNIVGKSLINDIYLGSFVMVDNHLIEVKLVLISLKNKQRQLDRIRKKIMSMAVKINIKDFELNLIFTSSETTPKNSSPYIGSCTLDTLM